MNGNDPARTGPSTSPRAIVPEVLADALARVVRAFEALRDGEAGLAEHLLDDLAADLWRMIEAPEAAR